MEAETDGPVDGARTNGGGHPSDIRAMIEEQKHRFSEQAARLAQVFRQTAAALEGEDREAGRYAHWIGEQAERVSTFLQERRVEDFAARARTLATRKNLLLAGSAAAVGYLCYRLWKGFGEGPSETGES